MIDYYNAFISYKHAPLDSKIAEQIQRRLERYPIPGKIKRKTGRKKIERVFRDKDELPITSDLTDTISNALEKADYLIVICSTNTCKSEWVKREISYFLRNHTRRQILTVLADGEPYDVIPQELLYETIATQAPDGTLQYVNVPLEPLSCDYRMPLKRAHKEELPRLAAALIGCSYDELVRRQRQYRLRRLTLAFTALLAAAVAFGGYMYYSKKQIDKSYHEVLVSQSRYFAYEAERLYQNEERVEAVQMALQALPSEEDDMPLTAEAIRAITLATHAYSGLAGNSIKVEWDYSMPTSVYKHKVSKDGTYLAAIDSCGNVRAWNTETHEVVFETVYQNSYGMEFLNDELLMIWTGHSINVYDMSSGEEAWNGDSGFRMFTYSMDPLITDDGKIYMLTGDRIMCYNVETGALLEEIVFPEDDSITRLNLDISPDKKHLAVMCCTWGTSGYALIYDFSTREFIQTAPVDNSDIRDIAWADNERLVLTWRMTDNCETSYDGNTAIHASDEMMTCCFNASDGEMLWTVTSTTTCDPSSGGGILVMPYTDQVYTYYGNTLTAINTPDGTVDNTYYTNTKIVDLSDRDEDGVPLFITVDGGYGFVLVDEESNGVWISDVFVDHIKNAVINNGAYINPSRSSKIFCYDDSICDEDWTAIDDGFSITTLGGIYAACGDYLVFISQEDEEKMINIIDMNEGEIVGTTVLDYEESLYYFDILGEYDGTIYLSFSGVDGMVMISVDIDSMSVSETPLTSDFYTSSLYAGSIHDGKFPFIDRINGNYVMCLYDLETDDVDECFSLSVLDYTSPVDYPTYLVDSGMIYYCDSDGDFLYDIEEEELVDIELPDDWHGIVLVADSADGSKIALTDGWTTRVFDREGEILYDISCQGREPLVMDFIDDIPDSPAMIVIAYSDNTICRYDAETGEFIAQSTLNCEGNSPTQVNGLEYDASSGLIYIQLSQTTDVVDAATWIELASVEDSFTYHAGSDRFYTFFYRYTSTYEIGYFEHYTVEQLVQKAHEYLNGIEMTPEMRTQYGL